MRRMRSDEPVGYPCRISLEDAPVGEELLLLTFTHQDGRSPYRASGPIFVRRGRSGAAQIVNELPTYLTLRPFPCARTMRRTRWWTRRSWKAAPPRRSIEGYLARAEVAYLHIHFARRGCFACRVDRG